MFVNVRPADKINAKEKLNNRVSMSKFKKIEIIGRGTYGTVYKAKNIDNGELYAIKKLSKIIIPQEGISKLFFRELSILKTLSHPNIIKLQNYNLQESREFAFLIFEFMQSDLNKEIFECRNNQIPKLGLKAHNNPQFKHRVQKIIKGIFQGINYCHSKNIFHRDLKPSNILVSKCLTNIKIADFGVARNYCSSDVNYPQKPYSRDIGTIYYRAPQSIFKGNIYGPSIDIWAIGMIFIECVIGQPLLKSKWKQGAEIQLILCILQLLGISSSSLTQQSLSSFDKLLQSLSEMKQQRIQLKVPMLNVIGKQGLNLLNQILQLNPKQRITAKDALNSPYLLNSIQY